MLITLYITCWLPLLPW